MFSVSFSPIVAKCLLKTLTPNEAVFTFFLPQKCFKVSKVRVFLLHLHQVIIVPAFTHRYSLNNLVPT